METNKDIDKPRFQYTTAIKKIRRLKARKKLIQGSTSAGKTYGIIPVLIDRAIKEPRIKITVVAESIPAVKDGCVDIFKSVMMDTNRWVQEHWIGNPMEYTFSNGSRIQFKSFDSIGKAKAAGKRDILFINEGNHILYSIADTLMVRSKETYIDFNADEEFWAHTEVLKEPNSEFLSLTYLDNEALPHEILEELLIKRDKAFYNPELPREKLYIDDNIKSSYWANWWLIYGLGEVGSYTERRIYSNFSIVDEIPAHAKQLPRGMDFGSSPDPTTQIDCYLDGIDLYCHEVWTENNLLPEEIKGAEDRICIADRMDIEAIRYARLELPNVPFKHEDKYYTTYRAKTHEAPDANDNLILQKVKEYKARYILADSSGAKEIADLQRRGYNAMGVKKRKGSVQDGINRLRGYNIKITKSSLGLKKGLESWMRKQDKNGKLTSEPDGHEPDQLAAIRYVVLGRELW